MSKPKLQSPPDPAGPVTAAALPAGVTAAAVCGLAAAWIAAGSIGLAGHALRHALVWVCLLSAVAAAWPKVRTWRLVLAFVIAMSAAVLMIASPLQPVNVLAVALALAALAAGRAGAQRRMLLAASQAVVIFGLYRIILTSVPEAWFAADAVGGWLGRIGGAVTGRPLALGPSFAGIDYLVLMVAFLALWLAATPGPRLVRGLAASGAVLAGHLVYLVVLSFAPELAAAIPTAAAADPNLGPFDKPWHFWPAVRTLVPWNFPVLAGLLQILVACGMMRWGPAPASETDSQGAAGPPENAKERQRAGQRQHPPDGMHAHAIAARACRPAIGIGLTAVAAAAAVVLAAATSLYGPPEDLKGKKIVVNKEGFLNWLRPRHGDYGRLAIGMYGMLGDFVESLGGELVLATQDPDEDRKQHSEVLVRAKTEPYDKALDNAAAVILIFPNKPWKAGQLEQIWKFVDRGGSLLVMGEHTIRENAGQQAPGAKASAPEIGRVISTREQADQLEALRPYLARDKFIAVSKEGEVYAHSLADTADEAWENFSRHPAAYFNDALYPTSIRVQFDCAQWAVGGWLECYETPAHPTTLGHRPERNDLGVVIGASLAARWPARPLILGRWGWSDWGDEGSPRAMIGNDRYDAGERLGDVWLAAEERLGRGKVIVFGDTSPLTNGINISSHGFTSALLAYLAGSRSEPSPWREAVALLAAAIAGAGALVRRASPLRTAVVALAAGLALCACAAGTHRANTLFPDGNFTPRPIESETGPGVDRAVGVSREPEGNDKGVLPEPNRLAYIDASHLEAYSPESLRDDGLMGLEYTLMRSGFLPLALTEFRPEALRKAALLVSIAPSRPFSMAQREAVREFVEGGGIFICTAGYDQSAAAAPLLQDFGLRVGLVEKGSHEPRPLGHFRPPYFNNQGKMSRVRFHAAWAVAADDSVRGPPGGKLEEAQVVAYGSGDVPVILMRPWGKGKAVLVGDTGFAMNKNLEHVDGSPFEDMRENADFWRWFLDYVRGRPGWTPGAPKPEEKQAPESAPAPTESPAAEAEPSGAQP